MQHARTLTQLRDFERAENVLSDLIGALRLVLPEGDPRLLQPRIDYARTLCELGRHDSARVLTKRIIEDLEKTPPVGLSDLHGTRMNAALLLEELGDYRHALDLLKSVLDAWSVALPEDHPNLQSIRVNYAAALMKIGDLQGAKILHEAVLRSMKRTHASDHPKLLITLRNYSDTLLRLGMHEDAKAIREKVLDLQERTLPPDHPDLQEARARYAITLSRLGDHQLSKQILETLLEIRERTLPAEHVLLLETRSQYATALGRLGYHDRVKEVLEGVLAARAKVLPPDHPDLFGERIIYCDSLWGLGHREQAVAAFESVLRDMERAFPADHPILLREQGTYAGLLCELGRLEAGGKIQQDVMRKLELALPPAHLDLQRIRTEYAKTLYRMHQSGDESARDLLDEHLVRCLEMTLRGDENSDLLLASRQLAIVADSRSSVLDVSLSLASEDVEPRITRRAFELIEELRDLTGRLDLVPRLALSAVGDLEAEVEERRRDVLIRRKAFDDFMTDPVLPPDAPVGTSVGSWLARLVRQKEIAEVGLAEALQRISGSADLRETVSSQEIAKALPQGAVGVSYWTYRLHTVDPSADPDPVWQASDHLAAFILDRSGEVSRVELGALGPIRQEIERLRAATIESHRGVRSVEPSVQADEERAGLELRRRLIDPVLAAVDEKTKQLVIALSSDLHLVPLDALPFEEGDRVGDRYRVAVTRGLHWIARDPAFELNPVSLLAMGHIAYDDPIAPLEPKELQAKDHGFRTLHWRPGQPAIQQSLAPLAHTKAEVEAIARTFSKAFDQSRSTLLTGRRADAHRLRSLAPSVRYLHIATHGWFAPSSVPSIMERQPGDARSGIRRTDYRDQVTGYAPLSLCGLALSGANTDWRGGETPPGVLSGTELARIDLSGVELAVLSACETNVGIVRGGQAIMSLQEALFTAGVRCSITSLWNVGDEATRELMARFYEGIWIKGETKSEALWNAKRQLREAKDSSGAPKHAFRDWAGWILIGYPDL